MGFEWNYNLYNGEKYTTTRVVKDKKTFDKICFIGSPEHPSKGCKVELYVQKPYSPDKISLYPDLERKFKGNFSKIIFTLPNNQGRIEMELIETTAPNNHRLFSMLEILSNK